MTLKKICAPFYVVQYEKSYCLWIAFVIVFGLANIWGAMLTGSASFSNSMIGGSGFIFAISICAPLIAEVFIKFIVNRRLGIENHFTSYKLISTSFNIVLIFVMAFLWSGLYRDSVCLQLIFCIASVVVSFYLFCVNQMEQHNELLEEFDDRMYEYLQKENANIKELEEKSKSVKKVSTRNGEVDL